MARIIKMPFSKNNKSNKLATADFDSNDDFLDFSEFDFNEAEASRKPIAKIGSGVVAGAKGVTRDKRYFEELVKRALPDGYGQAFNVVEKGGDTTRELYNKAAQDLSGPMLEIERAGSKMLPKVKGVLPKKAYNAIENRLNRSKADTGIRSDAQRKADSENSEINAFLADALGGTLKANDQIYRENRANQMVRDQIGDNQHRQSMSEMSTTREGIDRMVSFNDNQVARYQRKALELQYRQMLLQRDLLDVTNRHAGLSTKLLDAIKHNTALPEAQKIKLGEVQGQMMKQRMVAGVHNAAIDYTKNFADRFKSNIDNVIGNSIRNSIRDFSSGLEMAAMAGSSNVDKLEIAGDMAGSTIASWLGRELADKVGRWTSKHEGVKRVGSMLKYHSTAIPEGLNELASRDDGDWSMKGRLKRFGRSFLPSHIQDTKIGGSPILEGDQQLGFTSGANRSLIEIIPGYLSRILHMQRVQASGNPNIERIIYNADQGAFTTMGQAVKDASWRMFSPNSQVGTKKALDETLDKIDTGKRLTPEQREAMASQLMRDSMAAKRFDPAAYGTAGGFNDALPAEMRASLAQFFTTEFDLRDGKFDSRGEKISQAADVRQSFANLKEAIPDPKDMVKGYRDSGNRELMMQLGLINRQGQSDHINYDMAWNRVRGTVTSTDVVEEAVSLASQTGMNLQMALNLFMENPQVAQAVSEKLKQEASTPSADRLRAQTPVQTASSHSWSYTGQSMNNKEVLDRISTLGNTTNNYDNRRYSDNRSFVANNDYSQAFATAFNDYSQAYTDNSSSTVNTSNVDTKNISSVYRSSVNNNNVSIVDMAQAYSVATNVTLTEAMQAAKNDPAAVGAAVGEAAAAEAVEASGYKYKPRYTNARKAKGVRGKDRRLSNPAQPAAQPASWSPGYSASYSHSQKGEAFAGPSDPVADKLESLFGEGGTILEAIRANNMAEALNYEIRVTEEIRDILLTMPMGGNSPEEQDQARQGLLARLKGSMNRQGIMDGGRYVWDRAKSGFNKARHHLGKFIHTGANWAATVARTLGKAAKDVGTSVFNWITDVRDAGGRLVLEARKMRAGEYFDQATGKVIHSLKDIKGVVVDRLGNVVLTKAEYDAGIFNTQGKRIILTGLDWAKSVGEWAKDFIPAPGRAIGRAWNMLSQQLENRRLVRDIYVAGELDKPRLYAIRIKAGKYFVADGPTGTKVVKSWKDCTSEVMDEHGNIVLTEDDIKRGLVDYQGIPFGTGLAGRLAIKVGNAASKIIGGARGLMNLPKKAWARIKGLFGKGPAAALSIKDTMVNLTAQSLDIQTQQLDVLWKIHDLLDKRLPGKKVFGDSDGDGFRDGSWQGNAAKKDDNKDDDGKDGDKDKSGMGFLAKLFGGGKNLLAKLFGGGDDEEDDDGGGGGTTVIAGGGGGDDKDKKGKGGGKNKPKPKPKGKLGRLWAATGGRLGGLFGRGKGKAAAAAGAAGGAKKVGMLGKAKNFVGSPLKIGATLAAAYGGSKVLDATLGEDTTARNAVSTATDVGTGAVTASWLSGMLGGPTITSLLGIGGTGAGTGVAATAATGTAGGAGTVLGGGALATLGIPLAIGAAILGKVAYDGNKGWKKYKFGSYQPLRAFRMAQYGVKWQQTEEVGKIVELEQLVEPHTISMGSGFDISSAKLKMNEVYELFDLDDGWFSSNAKERSNFDVWFNTRFKPVFLTWMANKKSLAGAVLLNDLDDELDQDKKTEILKAVSSVPQGVYSVATSPFGDDPLTTFATEVDDQYKLALDSVKKDGTFWGRTKSKIERLSAAGSSFMPFGLGEKVYNWRSDRDAKARLEEVNKEGQNRQSEASGAVAATAGGATAAAGMAGTGFFGATEGGRRVGPSAYAVGAGLGVTAGGVLPMPVGGQLQLTLNREESTLQGTYGTLRLPDGTVFQTLELPWKNNSNSVSCIPTGVYECKKRPSAAFGEAYEVYGVPGRSAILIHAGNSAGSSDHGLKADSKGCILLGMGRNTSGTQKQITSSKAAMQTFYDKLQGRPFRLVVTGGTACLDPGQQNGVAASAGGASASTGAGAAAAVGGMSASAGGAANHGTSSFSGGTMADFAAKTGLGNYGDGGNATTGGDGMYRPGSGGAGASGGWGGGPLGQAVTHPGGGTGGDITMLPKIAENAQGPTALAPLIAAVSQMAGVDPGLMMTMCSIESGFRPKVGAGTSSARGLYQFINSTWRTMLNKYGSKYGISPNADQSDPAANALMGAEFLKENAAYLKSKTGRDPTDTELYMAHFMGAGGAAKALTTDPGQSGPGAMPAAAKANQSIYYEKDGTPRSMGGVMAELERRVRTHRYSGRTMTKVGGAADDVGYKAQIAAASAAGSPNASATGGTVDPSGPVATPPSAMGTPAAPASREFSSPAGPAGAPSGGREFVDAYTPASSTGSGTQPAAEAVQDPYIARSQQANQQAARSEAISMQQAKDVGRANDNMSNIMANILAVNQSMDRSLKQLVSGTKETTKELVKAVSASGDSSGAGKALTVKPEQKRPPMASRTPERAPAELPVKLKRTSSITV